MKTAKLFRNGKSQAIRLPKEFNLEGKEVYIRRVGHTVVLIPKGDPWKSLRESLELFTDDFLAEREQLPAETREKF